MNQMRLGARMRSVAWEIWLPIVVIGAWWLLSETSTSAFFPPLSSILATFVDLWFFDGLRDHALPSLVRFGAGFAIAMIVGVVVGLLLGLWEAGRRACAPVLEFFRAIPSTALIPPMLALLGFGDEMKISLIALGAVWPVLLNTIDGVRGIEPLQLDFARAYGLRMRRRITAVILPAASPQIFVGLRIALAIALIIMVISEFVVADDGLGYVVLHAQGTFNIREMWAGILMLGLIGYLMTALFNLVERKVLKWHRGWRQIADQS